VSYTPRPAPWETNSASSALGYTAQYSLRYAVARTTLELCVVLLNEGYVHSVNAVRYVCLAVEPILQVICVSWVLIWGMGLCGLVW